MTQGDNWEFGIHLYLERVVKNALKPEALNSNMTHRILNLSYWRVRFGKKYLILIWIFIQVFVNHECAGHSVLAFGDDDDDDPSSCHIV